jgi:hypothetical protein
MRVKRVVRGLTIAVMAAIAFVLFGYVVERLWNGLMPAIFGLRTITWLQALGLMILGKILFGGFHRHSRCGGRRGWGRQMGERWAQMTPEEREKFRAGIRGRWGCGFDREDVAAEHRPAV